MRMAAGARTILCVWLLIAHAAWRVQCTSVCEDGQCSPAEQEPATPPYIIIFDDLKANAYSPALMREKAHGCSQASTFRVAHQLKRMYGDTVTVIAMQARRKAVELLEGVYYAPSDPKKWERAAKDANMEHAVRFFENPTHVVLVRMDMKIAEYRARYPSARLVFWNQDQWMVKNQEKLRTLSHADVIVPVSAWHAQQLLEKRDARMNGQGSDDDSGAWLFDPAERIVGDGRIHPVYNALAPDDIDVVCWEEDGECSGVGRTLNHDGRDEYVAFLSSATKGLDTAMRAFKILQEEYPAVKLYIADPGYDQDLPLGESDAIVRLGSLSHRDVVEVMRGAFAVIGASTFGETFGCVFSESNAVGTPVAASNIGAAAEVLCPGAEQTVSLKKSGSQVLVEPLGQLLVRWAKEGRPAACARRSMTMECVGAEWAALLGLPLPLDRCGNSAEEVFRDAIY